MVGSLTDVKVTTEVEKLRRELKRVREENRKLKRIIAYGNMSTLETLIEQYMDTSRVCLKKIALEIQLTDYDRSGTDKVMELGRVHAKESIIMAKIISSLS